MFTWGQPFKYSYGYQSGTFGNVQALTRRIGNARCSRGSIQEQDGVEAGMKEESSAATTRTVFTLGTSTRSIDEFIVILKARKIARVCDVRSFPGSRRYPHFSRERLSVSLHEAGIDYVWLGERLGGYRKGGYEKHMEAASFEEGLEDLERIAARAPAAVICAEALPWRCHRRFIARALEERGWKVVHIIDSSRDWIPGESRQSLPLFDDGGG